MKRMIALLGLILILFCGCTPKETPADIAATTLPVYEFTARLCQGTGITVTRLVTENVSCLHDYTLSVRQARAAEAAQLIVISGAGLEDFMDDLLHDKKMIDSSVGIKAPDADHHHDHDHAADAHIWLSPEHAKQMATNICTGLAKEYPSHKALLEANLQTLLADIEALAQYADSQLSSISCREIITFHDGFGHLAEAFDLHILASVEEESGSEASAAELKNLIQLIREHNLPAIFTERNGSVSAADIIAAETGVKVYALDMAMSGHSWLDAMYHNIDTIKEALG